MKHEVGGIDVVQVPEKDSCLRSIATARHTATIPTSDMHAHNGAHPFLDTSVTAGGFSCPRGGTKATWICTRAARKVDQYLFCKAIYITNQHLILTKTTN